MNFDKVDLELWKEMQDEFSKNIGLPVVTIDTQGNEIVVSGKYPFLYEMIKKGNSKFLADKRLAEIVNLEEKEYSFFSYYDGLYGVAYPIKLF